ncbi:hypothetical protein [Cupriavidus pauculus]|uniref:hypothetical protein n=1 Tax=Cupriavidus pauculus TaxID=82633 RepID=UPI001EE1E977|nr:hypothetical protein [Cupriavidus pauculus]GJG98149.1 hypothetical protein CBA19C6_26690 [Cupriavidus pauculus]
MDVIYEYYMKNTCQGRSKPLVFAPRCNEQAFGESGASIISLDFFAPSNAWDEKRNDEKTVDELGKTLNNLVSPLQRNDGNVSDAATANGKAGRCSSLTNKQPISVGA